MCVFSVWMVWVSVVIFLCSLVISLLWSLVVFLIRWFSCMLIECRCICVLGLFCVVLGCVLVSLIRCVCLLVSWVSVCVVVLFLEVVGCGVVKVRCCWFLVICFSVCVILGGIVVGCVVNVIRWFCCLIRLVNVCFNFEVRFLSWLLLFCLVCIVISSWFCLFVSCLIICVRWFCVLLVIWCFSVIWLVSVFWFELISCVNCCMFVVSVIEWLLVLVVFLLCSILCVV